MANTSEIPDRLINIYDVKVIDEKNQVYANQSDFNQSRVHELLHANQNNFTQLRDHEYFVLQKRTSNTNSILLTNFGSIYTTSALPNDARKLRMFKQRNIPIMKRYIPMLSAITIYSSSCRHYLLCSIEKFNDVIDSLLTNNEQNLLMYEKQQLCERENEISKKENELDQLKVRLMKKQAGIQMRETIQQQQEQLLNIANEIIAAAESFDYDPAAAIICAQNAIQLVSHPSIAEARIIDE